MSKTLSSLFLIIASFLTIGIGQPATAAEGRKGNLVTVQWLKRELGNNGVLVLDASPAQLYAAKHIPGAINADFISYGAQEAPLADMERRLQSWGVSAGKRIVIYDQGGTFWATRVFFDLYYYGFAADDLLVLDGGLAKWQEAGGPLTADPTPAPAQGSFRIRKVQEDARVRLPEFLVASGDPANHVLVEALEPSYHFGETKFFDRAGHVPNGVMLPSADFFNADKTFKPADEIRQMMTYLGIKPGQQVHSYCGGGVAASVPFFALKFILNYPTVKLYKESQMEWLRDDRELPLWTYDAPFLKRDMTWLQGWGSRMMRTYGVSRLSVVDVRPAEAYQQGHVPYAVNLPAEVFRSHVAHPAKLAELLGPSGVDPTDEAVIVSEGGLNPASALAFLMLEKLGQKRVSIMMESVDDWALSGFPLAKEATVVGARKTPQDLAVRAAVYPARPRQGVMITTPADTRGQYPKVFIASGKNVAAKPREGTVIHVPYTDLLNANGTPKAAKDLWKVLSKAGVPRYAEIVCFSDEPGEAAVNYFILKLMGYPDVKVWLV
jgi:thiosulfate/3-mercaptopyruvate sulfurtransferase